MIPAPKPPVGPVPRVKFDKLVTVGPYSRDEWTADANCILTVHENGGVSIRLNDHQLVEYVSPWHVVQIRPSQAAPDDAEPQCRCSECQEYFATPQALGAHKTYMHKRASR